MQERLEKTGRTSAKMYNAPINFTFFIFFKRPAAVASLCLLYNSCSVCITPQYCCFIASTDLSKLSHLVLQAFSVFWPTPSCLWWSSLSLHSHLLVLSSIMPFAWVSSQNASTFVLICQIHLECIWCIHLNQYMQELACGIHSVQSNLDYPDLSGPR